MPAARTTSRWFSSGWPNRLLAVLSILLTTGSAQADTPGVLRLRTLEGEGQVFAAGSRSLRPVTVQITDETGKPVAGASVSFHLPDDGPSGAFTGGMRTDVAITAADGKATASNIQWDHVAGQVSLRVTAAKDQVRAGAVVSLYLSDAPVSTAKASSRGRRTNKWLTIGLIVGGAAAGGLALGLSHSNSSGSPTEPAASTLPSVQIGSPTISIGRP
jgi:hypothetical protein